MYQCLQILPTIVAPKRKRKATDVSTGNQTGADVDWALLDPRHFDLLLFLLMHGW